MNCSRHRPCSRPPSSQHEYNIPRLDGPKQGSSSIGCGSIRGETRMAPFRRWCRFDCAEPGKDVAIAEGNHRRPNAAGGGHDCSLGPLKCRDPLADCGTAKNAVWGSFNMGDAGGFSDETPVHQVRPNSFYVKITEVTTDEYVSFLNPGRRGSTSSPWHIMGSTTSMKTAASRSRTSSGKDMRAPQTESRASSARSSWNLRVRQPSGSERHLARSRGVLQLRQPSTGSRLS
jgi:hypothetical protein